jgi:hypothetical protein
MTKTKKQTKRRRGQSASKAMLGSEFLYVVMALNSTVEITAFGRNEKVELSYADGMVGAMPIFNTREAAEAYAGDEYQIQVITAKEPNVQVNRPQKEA